VPALALAVLGLRAVRLERIERQQQLREQQAQTARLAVAAISAALAQIETSEAASGDYPAFSLEQGGLVLFPRERVYFGEFGRQPAFARRGWLASTRQLIDQAQAAEAQQRAKDAVPLYQRLGSVEARLRPWAELSEARIRGAIPLLANPEWSRSEGTTPTGLPAALLACAYVEEAAQQQQARFVPLLEATLESLRAGRWWLSYEERRFHDGELRRLLALAGAGGGMAEDAHLEELAAVDRVVRRLAPRLREVPLRHFEAGVLVLWSGAQHGVAIPQPRLASLLGAVLAPLFPSGAVAREGQGGLNAAALRAITGWELAFSSPAETGGFDQRRLLWYSFICLLVIMLMAGLAMTVRVVRREVELARLQSEFVAAVTHEFKSPITSIRLLMERIAGGRLQTPEAAGEYYAAVGRETDRLERLVNRLLESQKIQAGQKRYRFEPASLVELAEAAVERLRPQAEAKSIAIKFETSGEIPELLLDKAAMADALENLLDNAIKYSPSGTQVSVVVEVAERQVSVEVRDQGTGIDADDLPRIFDRFYRGRQNAQGTGLGLALVKAAAEAQGGTVTVTSVPGGGSTFYLRLPIRGGAWRES
jgi:signal transduction histidine kinase